MGKCLTYDYVPNYRLWELTEKQCPCNCDENKRPIVYPKPHAPRAIGCYPVLVCYDVLPIDMIWAAKPDYLDEPISNYYESFKTNRKGCAEVNINLSHHMLLSESTSMRHAEFHELVALLATYRDIPDIRGCCIAGLGSLNKSGYSPYFKSPEIGSNTGDWFLLGQYDGRDGWSPDWLYAVVVSEANICRESLMLRQTFLLPKMAKKSLVLR